MIYCTLCRIPLLTQTHININSHKNSPKFTFLVLFSVQIAKNEIDEKEKYIESLKQRLETEKKKTAKLEQV